MPRGRNRRRDLHEEGGCRTARPIPAGTGTSDRSGRRCGTARSLSARHDRRGADVRRHHSFLLRETASRTACRGGARTGLSRDRRSRGRDPPPSGVARVYRTRAFPSLAATGGAARDRRETRRSGRSLRHRLRIPRCRVPAGECANPRCRPGLGRTGSLLGRSEQALPAGR